MVRFLALTTVMHRIERTGRPGEKSQPTNLSARRLT
jgi:hypothetical protein